MFVGNKLGKHIAYDSKLSNEEKISKVNKLVELYNSILDDEDYEILIKVIKSAVNEVIHRNKLIGFNSQESEELNNEINR